MNSIPAPLARSPVAQASTRRLEIRSSRHDALTRARRIGLVVLALQLSVLLAWSGVEAARHVQANDFSGFYRLWYLVSQGTLDPSSGFSSQAVLIEWPLAILGLLWPHPITLLVVQDFAIVGAETVAFLWICELLAARDDTPATAYSLTGLALLVLDPWIYWSASWDYHSEPLGTLFAVLAARDLFRGRRIAVLWCVLTLTCGLVPATYLVGIGIALLITRSRHIVGVAVAATGTAWFEVMVKLGAGQGISNTKTTRQTEAAVSVTGRLMAAIPTIRHHWLDLIANLAPGGLLGVLTAPVIGIAGVTLGENFSQGNPNALVPSFQGMPLYVFVPIGTILALTWLYRRYSTRLANVLAAVAVINVVGWGAVWIPQAVPTWLRVSPVQSEAISHIEAMIPESAGVVASQGIVGDFAGREYVGAFNKAPTRLPVVAPYTWFVVAPYAGIETATVGESTQLITTLARDPRAKLEYVNDSDVWAFRVRVPRHGRHYLDVGEPTGSYPAGLFATYGTAVRHSRLRSWYMEGNDHASGPILWGDYFLKGVGRYRARVRLAGPGLAQAQIWDTTTNKELDAHQLRLRSRAQTVTLTGAITRSDPKHSAKALHGFGLFQIDPVGASLGNVLEIRVYAESASTIKVLHVSLTPVR